MSSYFFNFHDGESLALDDMGLELSSTEHAYLEAVAAARAMWPELLAERRDPRRCAFEVADAHGQVLFRLTFDELLDDCRNALVRPPRPTAAIVHTLLDTHRRASRAKENLQRSFADVRLSLAEAHALMARLPQRKGRRPLPKA
jgi:hypothetical protein